MNEPTDGLPAYQSTRRILAGCIAEVRQMGCYVLNSDATKVFREFQPGMRPARTVKEGDWWIVYEDGIQSILTKESFEGCYARVPRDQTPEREKVAAPPSQPTFIVETIMHGLIVPHRIQAKSWEIDKSGALIFYNGSVATRVYACGVWKMMKLELVEESPR